MDLGDEMINTILFDLDGTVLPMDFDKFMELYFYNMGIYFKEKIDGNTLAKYIMASTEVMIKTTNGDSNEDSFMNHFASLVNDDIEEYKKMFLEYYNSLFDNVRASTYRSTMMRESVDLLKEKGYEVVLATNPLFPMVANHHRIRWAGFEPDEFSYISSFENNHYCKPHIEYYNEVLQSIGKKPEECLMVGNDVFDDLAARKLGIKTYLITDHMLNRHNQTIQTDYKGNYTEFLDFVKNIKILF